MLDSANDAHMLAIAANGSAAGGWKDSAFCCVGWYNFNAAWKCARLSGGCEVGCGGGAFCCCDRARAFCLQQQPQSLNTLTSTSRIQVPNH